MMARSIPVGMYHHVNQHAGDHITVTVDNFRRQMEWLHRANYETLDAVTFAAVLRGERALAPRTAVLTFDDAWLDLYVHAFPVLKEFGHKFIVFVVSDWTDTASQKPAQQAGPPAFPKHRQAEKRITEGQAQEVICSWEQLWEMQSSGLASIENHTASHLHSARATPERLRTELLRCRSAIREKLGSDSRHLCWPYGSYCDESLKVARELDFTTTYLVRRGVNLAGGNTFAVKRFTVEDRDEAWLDKQLRTFSNPIHGFLYARLKPDRWFRRGR